MASLQELIAQRDALERQIELTKKERRAGAIEQIRALMREYDLSASDLSSRAGSKSGSAKKGGKVAAKYRNTATGDTWSGRGLQPKWLKAALTGGRKLEDFAV